MVVEFMRGGGKGTGKGCRTGNGRGKEGKERDFIRNGKNNFFWRGHE